MTLKDQYVRGGYFGQKDLSGSIFENCTFFGCDFSCAIYNNVLFGHCTFEYCKFHDSTLTDTRFQDSKLINTAFYGSKLTRVDFKSSRAVGLFSLDECEIKDCSWNLECKAFVGELLALEALNDGGLESSERRAWALFISRDAWLCREHYLGLLFPERIKEWGFVKMKKEVEKDDPSINPESLDSILHQCTKTTTKI